MQHCGSSNTIQHQTELVLEASARPKNQNGRTMRECIEHLREGWYGNEAYRQWVAGGRKKPEKLRGEKGERLRKQQARRRFGKKKTAADWILLS